MDNMPKTLIETLEETLQLCEADRDRAVAAVARVKLELAHARAAQAKFDGHVWAGKAVKRQEVRRAAYEPFRRTPAPDRTVTLRGIVSLCLTDNGVLYRGHWPKAGEWFVLSASGLTAYSLGEGWELDE